jgi:hypothetical protein
MYPTEWLFMTAKCITTMPDALIKTETQFTTPYDNTRSNTPTINNKNNTTIPCTCDQHR